MRILICDDARDCVERLQRYVGQYMRRHGVGAEFVATTDSAAAAADERLYDLAFLDVEMEPVGGIEIAKRLKQRNDRVVIFLVTAYDAYLDAAMDLHVFRFFEKPFDEQRLYAGLDRAMEYIDKSSVDVFLRSEGRYLRIFADDILVVRTPAQDLFLPGPQKLSCQPALCDRIQLSGAVRPGRVPHPHRFPPAGRVSQALVFVPAKEVSRGCITCSLSAYACLSF